MKQYRMARVAVENLIEDSCDIDFPWLPYLVVELLVSNGFSRSRPIHFRLSADSDHLIFEQE